MLSNLLIRLMLLNWVFHLAACSNNPENPGLCALNCDNAMIGPFQGSLSAVTKNVAYTCSLSRAGQAVGDPLMLKYLALSSEQASVDDTTDEAAAGEVAGELQDDITVPIPSISFEPIVNGALSSEPEHNPNVEINGDVLTPAKYKGILTGKDEWCTDTCGVASLEVVPLCPPAGESSELKINLMSGALASEEITVTITTEAAAN